MIIRDLNMRGANTHPHLKGRTKQRTKIYHDYVRNTFDAYLLSMV